MFFHGVKNVDYPIYASELLTELLGVGAKYNKRCSSRMGATNYSPFTPDSCYLSLLTSLICLTGAEGKPLNAVGSEKCPYIPVCV
jgi:hypothetical protein